MSENFLAVVGMAGRFPGAADIAEFWSRIADGQELVTRLSDTDGYTPAYGVVADGDLFDAGFFGYSHREALMLDPQHRAFLECAWEALEQAGYDPQRYDGLIGVYGGSGDTGHFGVLRNHADQFPGVSDWQFRLASGADFLTSRVSYKLGLTGPAVTVQTACSTSLVAVHVATQALLAGECDIALAGGVTLRVPEPMGEFSDDGVLSRDGRCRSFDAAAGGTVGSDGVGVVVLKRYQDAVEDGDNILAVIRGSAVNNDGSAKMGFTTPSVDGQAAAVRMAHIVSDVDPRSIGYVEAHGTGTPVGDPIEVRALAKAFNTSETGFCTLGSVKANAGHTDAAAGVIGLIKAVLCLQNELIPGTVHFDRVNPQIELDETPFVVTAQAQPWPRNGTPRRAGVNSLGIGGTNAHVILEEAPEQSPSIIGRPYQVWPISARSRQAAQQLATRMTTAAGNPADVAWTLQTGRREFPYRTFLVGGQAVPPVLSAEKPPPVAFLFPGQGGQHLEMARDLYDHEPVFRSELDMCAELGVDVPSILYSGVDGGELSTMQGAQPVLFSVQYALARLWQSWGVQPDVVAGHSLGAYAAATIAGVLTPADAMSLVLARGRLLQSMPTGKMLAVGLSEPELEPMLSPALSIAAINGPGQCVVAGLAPDVAQLQARLTAAGVEARLLHISAAAHSTLVDPVVAEFERHVAGVRLRPPTVTWISDRTGLPVSAQEACDPSYWSGHLRHTVRFSQALETLLTAGDGPLLEIGPGRTLGTLARQHPACQPDRTIVASLPHPSDATPSGQVMMAAAGRLWQAGVPLDWAALHADAPRRRVPLPGYPFERKRFRLDLPESSDSDVVEDDDEYEAPVGPIEEVLALAYGKVLGMRQVGVHDHFFDLGGDSLVASQLLTLIRQELGPLPGLTVRTIFQAPTIRQLAQRISEEQ